MKTYSRSSAFCFLSLYVVIVFTLLMNLSWRSILPCARSLLTALRLFLLYCLVKSSTSEHGWTHKVFTCTMHGFHATVWMPHTAFCYNMCEDLAAGELENVPRRPSAHPPHHEDIFCIVKRWMHSHQAAGPVLVLPRARFALLRSPGPLQKEDGHGINAS